MLVDGRRLGCGRAVYLEGALAKLVSGMEERGVQLPPVSAADVGAAAARAGVQLGAAQAAGAEGAMAGGEGQEPLSGTVGGEDGTSPYPTRHRCAHERPVLLLPLTVYSGSSLSSCGCVVSCAAAGGDEDGDGSDSSDIEDLDALLEAEEGA